MNYFYGAPKSAKSESLPMPQSDSDQPKHNAHRGADAEQYDARAIERPAVALGRLQCFPAQRASDDQK